MEVARRKSLPTKDPLWLHLRRMKYVKYSVAWPPAGLLWQGFKNKRGLLQRPVPTCHCHCHRHRHRLCQPELSGTKVIQIKIQLSAGGLQCSLNFFSQQNEVRVCAGGRGLARILNSEHMPSGCKTNALAKAQVLHAICTFPNPPFGGALSRRHCHLLRPPPTRPPPNEPLSIL